jgi:hypothetical protein
MTTTTDTTTRAAAASAAADDAASVREASVAAATAATITLRDVAELATFAARIADELASALAEGDDPSDLRDLAARAGVVTDALLIDAVVARQNLTLAAEGVAVLRASRWCATCGEAVSDGSPLDVCGTCDLVPFGPAWEDEQREAFGW